ncbi:hypothetical protein BGX27_004063 [Mortierella sp. AM989]|nr:hypothetical protein BGX27_004063 [Mortierella sp. AM989]
MANLTITAPNATSFLTAGSSLPIVWAYSGPMPPNPPTISIELVDNASCSDLIRCYDESKKLFTGPWALFSNLLTTSGSASWAIPKLGFIGNSFSIILVANINNQATILAQGPSFSILPEGTAAPVTQTVAQSNAVTTRWSLADQTAVAASALLVYLM